MKLKTKNNLCAYYTASFVPPNTQAISRYQMQRSRSFLRVLPCAICICLVSFAAQVTANEPKAHQAFVETYRCAVINQLKLIHSNKTRSRDRFFLLALEAEPQAYVQCLFQDSDTKILCEASSGFHGPRRGGGQIFHVASDRLKALIHLGFSADGSAGNYQQLIEPPMLNDFRSVADLILSALFQGYGANIHSRLIYNSPLSAPHEFMPTECIPMG